MTTVRLDPSCGAGTSTTVESPGEKRPEVTMDDGFAALLAAFMGISPQAGSLAGNVQPPAGGPNITGVASVMSQAGLSGVAVQPSIQNPSLAGTAAAARVADTMIGQQLATAGGDSTAQGRQAAALANGASSAPVQLLAEGLSDAGSRQPVSPDLIQQAASPDRVPQDVDGGGPALAAAPVDADPAGDSAGLASAMRLASDTGTVESQMNTVTGTEAAAGGSLTVEDRARFVSNLTASDSVSPDAQADSEAAAADPNLSADHPHGAVADEADSKRASRLTGDGTREVDRADGDGQLGENAGTGTQPSGAAPEQPASASVLAPGTGSPQDVQAGSSNVAAFRQTSWLSASPDFQYLVEQPISADQVMDLVVESLQDARDGEYAITLRLKPEHLGEVRLQLQLTGREVQTRFEVTTPEARQLLEQQGDLLREDLQQAGFTLSGFTVSTGGGSRQGRDRWDLEEWLWQGRPEVTGVTARSSVRPGRRAAQPRHTGMLDRLA